MFKIFLNQIPNAPLFLSLGVVFPFVLLSAGLWFLPYEYKLLALYNLLNYSVIILSFIGAVHWGVAITKGIKSYKHYLIAITPALLSWFMLIGFFANYIVILIFFLLAFLTMFFIDMHYTKSGFFPVWYLPLRKLVSIIVIISIGLAAIAVNIKVL